MAVNTAGGEHIPFMSDKELSIVAICIDPDLPILERFLSSVRQYCQCEYELILVDNAGENGERSDFLKKNCDKYIRLAERVRVAEAWNFGIAAADGQYVLVTNDDVVVSRNWFALMKDVFVQNEKAGMVVPVMNHSVPEQTPRVDISHIDQAHAERLTPFKQFVWGAFMLFSRDSLFRVNNFSLDYEIGGGEDLDMCFQMYETGLDVYVDHRVFIYHEWGSTGLRILGAERRRELYEQSYVTFKKKWIKYTSEWDKPKGVSGTVTSAFAKFVSNVFGSRRTP
ncbi:MAG: glycosyltransferase [Gemmatimonadaceae bacterium]